MQLLLVLSMLMATPQDTAQAEVDVAVSVIIVKRTLTPDLPTKKGRYQESPDIEEGLVPLPLEGVQVEVDPPKPAGVTQLESQLGRTITELQAEIERLQEKAPKSAPDMPLEVWIFTAEDVHGKGWCGNCGPYKTRIGPGDNRMVVRHSTAAAVGEQVYPAVRFKVRGEWSMPVSDPVSKKYYLPATFEELYKIVKEATDDSPRGVAGGILGAIKGKQSLIAAKQRIRSVLGYNNQGELRWDRASKKAEFNLLRRQGQWTTENILGESGRVSIKAAKGFLIDHVPASIGFAYVVQGDDLGIDIDLLLFPGLAAKMGYQLDDPHAAGFIDPMTLYTVLSAIRSLWLVFHPSCDLMLGGSISCTIELMQNDDLEITFHDAPSIRFVMLWQFMLRMEKMVVAADVVHLYFSGSRLINNLDLGIKD